VTIRSLHCLSLVAVLASVALATGCGGGGGASPSAPSTPPPAAQEVVIQQGTLSLRDGIDAVRHLGRLDTAVVPFTTSTAGMLKITVDYTFVDTELLNVLFRGSCSVELAALVKCEVVPADLVRGKPYVLTVGNLAPGAYTLAVSNGGFKAEAVSYRITLTR
jgi:hypothetical protein